MKRTLVSASVALALSAGLAGAAYAQAAAQPKATPPPASARNWNLPDYVYRPGQMVDVGGYRLNLYCAGAGSPTVLLLSGGGWGAVAYAGVQPRLAKTTRVCAYDRAGAGFSDVGPIPQKADQATRDLEALISGAGLKGPFVLVGWSLGGTEARGFAYQHPEAVAGVVTIDGSTFDFEPKTEQVPSWRLKTLEILQECHAAAKAGVLASNEALYARCRPGINPLDFIPTMRTTMAEETLDPSRYELQIASMSAMDANTELLRRNRRDLGDIPYRALLAGDHFPLPDRVRPAEDDASQREFIFNSYRIMAQARNGRMIVVPRARHGIQFDNPDLVAETIEDVIAEVRAKTAPGR